MNYINLLLFLKFSYKSFNSIIMFIFYFISNKLPDLQKKKRKNCLKNLSYYYTRSYNTFSCNNFSIFYSFLNSNNL